MRSKCSSRLREIAQQLTVAAGLEGKNAQSRGSDHAQYMFYRSP